MNREEVEAVIRPRDQPRRQWRHCYDDLDPGRDEHLRGFPVARDRYFVDRVLLRNERGLGIGYYVTTIVLDIVLGVLAAISWLVLAPARVPRRPRWRPT